MADAHCLTISGPARFYCAANDCQTLLDNDADIFCEPHNTIFPEPAIRGGLTAAQWRSMIARTREDERRKGWHLTTVSSTIPVTNVQPHYATNGLGQQFVFGDSPGTAGTGGCMPWFDTAAAEKERKRADLVLSLDELQMVIAKFRRIVETW